MKTKITLPLILLSMMWYDLPFYIVIPTLIVTIRYVFAPVLDYCRN